MLRINYFFNNYLNLLSIYLSLTRMGSTGILPLVQVIYPHEGL